MQLHGCGKADRFPRQPFNSRTEREMFSFDLLGIPFARAVSGRLQLPCICALVIGVEARDPKRLQEFL
jgi:hypothetical protein